ncbi:hypothetical protein [Streptomyces sp. NPDC059575]|uniref:hypothetical protein n=1 Tax=Streptomyces sp. NPDC059575 TaxID=3346872 RepID=UPI0036CDC494
MSSEREYEAGAYGVHEAAGATPVPPTVYYQPQPAAAPTYDEYADPAVAHGWQKAYDATRELPVITPLMEPPPATPAPVEGSRAAARRRRGSGRRRVAVAGAVVGTVGAAAAAIAGLVASPSGGDSPASDRVTPGASETPTTRPDVAEPQTSAPVAPSVAPTPVTPLRATTQVAAPPPTVASSAPVSATPTEKASPTTLPTATTALPTAPPTPTVSASWPTRGGGRHRHHW